MSGGTCVGDLDLALVLVEGQLPGVEAPVRQFAQILRVCALRALRRRGG